MSPETCQDPAAQLLLRGQRGMKGPTQLRERGGAHAAPHQTKRTALLLLLLDSCCPRESTSRAGARRKHPGREEPGAHPILPAKPPGATPASAACHPAVRLPVALGSRHSEPPLPGYLSLGPAGSPAGARGPSSNRPLLPGSCQRGPGPALMPVPGCWASGPQAAQQALTLATQPGHKHIKYETKTKYVFSIKAQLSCLPGQVLMNARPRTEGRAGRRVGGRGLLCPPKRGKGGDRTTREPVLV